VDEAKPEGAANNKCRNQGQDNFRSQPSLGVLRRAVGEQRVGFEGPRRREDAAHRAEGHLPTARGYG